MATTAYQYTIFDKIKFGFSMLFRCMNCFRNIFEKFQFMQFATQICPNTVPFIYCPYCKDKVYALESQPGGYELLITFDQSILATLTIKLMGTNGTDYTITWGDDTLSTGTFDGTLQTFTHDYVTEGVYNFKLFLDPDNLLQIAFSTQKAINAFPSFLPFQNINYINIQYNNFTGLLPSFDGLQLLTLFNIRNCGCTGSFPTITDLPELGTLNFRQNIFTGNFPIITGAPKLWNLIGRDHTFTGNSADISNLPKIQKITFYNGNFNGIIPAFGNLPDLLHYKASSNSITGNIPSVTGCPVMIEYELHDNQFTGYVASTIPLTFIEFQAQNNLLTQVAVDQILSDFNDNLGARPGAGTINLAGTGNATPSAAGLVHKANIIAHGWTCLTN